MLSARQILSFGRGSGKCEMDSRCGAEWLLLARLNMTDQLGPDHQASSKASGQLSVRHLLCMKTRLQELFKNNKLCIVLNFYLKENNF